MGPGSRPVEGSPTVATSAEELFAFVMDALSRSDADALRLRLLPREEYLGEFWSAFESSGAGNKGPASLHWSLLDAKSTTGARRAVQDFGGRTLRFDGYEVRGGTRTYGPYSLWNRPVLFAVADSDERVTLDFLGSIVVKDDTFRILSFRD